MENNNKCIMHSVNIPLQRSCYFFTVHIFNPCHCAVFLVTTMGRY